MNEPFTTIGGQRNRAIERATCDWILVVDADERGTPALQAEVDVLLLGTGRSIARAPEVLVAALVPLGIGVEAMDSAAAARTYNVLLSEGRRIAAALLPVD